MISEISDISGYPFYWKNTSGYLIENDAVSEGLSFYDYTVTNLFRDGNDVFQIGAAFFEESHHFFLAKNNVIIADEVTYTPDPITEFNAVGECFNKGLTDADSKVYIYGSWNVDDYIRPGYTVNGGDWTDVDTAVWRDRVIVAEVWDDDPLDDLDYEYTSMIGADFE